MKKIVILLVCSLPLLVVGQEDHPQRPPGQGGFGRHRPPPSPIMEALDRNHDGVLSSAEISGATAALLELDTNKDGQLTQEELRPKRPHMERNGQRNGGEEDQLPPPPPEE